MKQVEQIAGYMGLHVLTGQNWDKIRNMICSHLSPAWCQQDIHWQPEFYSKKALLHLLQNGMSQRFQEYSSQFAKH